MGQMLHSARDLVRTMPLHWKLDGPTPHHETANNRGAVSLLRAKPAEVESNVSDAHIFAYVVQGEPHHRLWLDGVLAQDGPVAAGALHLTHAGLKPRAVISGPLIVLHFYLPHRELIRKARLAGWSGQDGQLEIINPQFASDQALDNLCSFVVAALQGGDPFDRQRLDHLSDLVGLRLLQRWSNVADKLGRTSRGGLSPTQLRRACEAMDASTGDRIDLETLAHAAGVSPSHFSRAFKQSLQMPPFQWLLQRRIERAQAMLATGHASLADIALAVGFAAQPQFTTAFRRVTGMTPGAWRRAQRS